MKNEEWTYPTTGYILTFICVSRGRSPGPHSLSFLFHHPWDFQEPLSIPHKFLYPQSWHTSTHYSPIPHADLKHSPTTTCPFSYWSCILPSVFCPHLKHFCSLFTQDPRIRNINAVDQTSGNAKNHLESLLNRFLGSTLKFSFIRSEVRAPEFEFVTSSQPVLTLQLVTAGLLWISTALKTTLDLFISLTWHILYQSPFFPHYQTVGKYGRKGTNPSSLSFPQINTLTSVKLCAPLMADILITFTDTVLDSSNLLSHPNTILPSASCFTEIKASDFFSQLASYQNISVYLIYFPFLQYQRKIIYLFQS